MVNLPSPHFYGHRVFKISREIREVQSGKKDEDMLSHHSNIAGLVLPERRYLRSTMRTKIMAFLTPAERAGEGFRGGMKALSEDG